MRIPLRLLSLLCILAALVALVVAYFAPKYLAREVEYALLEARGMGQAGAEVGYSPIQTPFGHFSAVVPDLQIRLKAEDQVLTVPRLEVSLLSWTLFSGKPQISVSRLRIVSPEGTVETDRAQGILRSGSAQNFRFENVRIQNPSGTKLHVAQVDAGSIDVQGVQDWSLTQVRAQNDQVSVSMEQMKGSYLPWQGDWKISNRPLQFSVHKLSATRADQSVVIENGAATLSNEQDRVRVRASIDQWSSSSPLSRNRLSSNLETEMDFQGDSMNLSARLHAVNHWESSINLRLGKIAWRGFFEQNAFVKQHILQTSTLERLEVSLRDLGALTPMMEEYLATQRMTRPQAYAFLSAQGGNSPDRSLWQALATWVQTPTRRLVMTYAPPVALPMAETLKALYPAFLEGRATDRLGVRLRVE